MRLLPLLIFCGLLISGRVVQAQAANLGEIEAQKCEEKIATVQRDIFAKYDDALGELQFSLQKAADLEGALAVRAERQRLATEQVLSSENYVKEPKALRTLQTQFFTRMQELIAQLVQETMPRLIEYKRSLTVAGKLDEAVNVRTAIEKLQGSHVPIVRPEAGSVVPAEALLLAYSGDRARADKTYKGQKITVRGVVGGFRQDAADARHFLIFFTGSAGGWVQCTFQAGDYRFREDKGPFGAVTLVITPKDSENVAARVQKGQAMEIRGVCEGLDETVRLVKCDLPH